MSEHEPFYPTSEAGRQADKRFCDALDGITYYPDDSNRWVYLLLVSVDECDRGSVLLRHYTQRWIDMAVE